MFGNNIKITLRTLRKNLLTTGLNIAGLATGVAVCLFIAIWLQRELSYDNFHPEADRIFRVVNTFTSESESFSQAPSGPALGAHLDEELPEIETACRYFEDEARLSVDNKSFFENELIFADSNFFQFFNFPLLEGNPATALSDRSKIALTESMAKKYFGNENPIGKVMEYGDDNLLTVGAVIADPPPNSQIEFSAVLPMHLMYHYAETFWGGYKIDEQWVGGWMFTFLRLRNPTEWKDTEAYVNQVVAEYSKKEWEENKMSYKYTLQPMESVHLHSNLRYDVPSNGSMARVWMFGAIGMIVLLLACINYINLTTAGAIKRAKETSVRKVVGATRKELVTQFLTDSFVLALFGTVIGVALFQFFLPAFCDLTEQVYVFDFSIKNILLLLSFALTIGTLSGIYPAFVLSSFKPSSTLKGVFQNSTQGVWMRKGLVVFQFAATVALIAGILVIKEQMSFIQSKELGFQGDAVVQINFLGSKDVRENIDAFRNKLLENPSIKSFSRHGGSVVGGLGNGWTTTEDLEGKEISTSAYNLSVDPTYFETYNMELAVGRFFSDEISTDTAQAVLVNEAAVRTFGWQKPENAIGKPYGKGDRQKRVVGVVKDFHFESLHKPVEALFIHFSRGGSLLSLQIDQSKTKEAIHHMEATWGKMFPAIPLDYAFVDSQVAEQYGNEQTTETLFLLFSSLSLFIACLGLFGLVTFMAEQRVKEIGIRKVLGATTIGLVSLLSKDFLKLVAIALVIASPLAYYLMDQWLADFAYRIDIQWWVFLMAGILAIGVALLTVSFQSVKAALANPVESLRSE